MQKKKFYKEYVILKLIKKIPKMNSWICEDVSREIEVTTVLVEAKFLWLP